MRYIAFIDLDRSEVGAIQHVAAQVLGPSAYAMPEDEEGLVTLDFVFNARDRDDAAAEATRLYAQVRGAAGLEPREPEPFYIAEFGTPASVAESWAEEAAAMLHQRRWTLAVMAAGAACEAAIRHFLKRGVDENGSVFARVALEGLVSSR